MLALHREAEQQAQDSAPPTPAESEVVDRESTEGIASIPLERWIHVWIGADALRVRVMDAVVPDAPELLRKRERSERDPPDEWLQPREPATHDAAVQRFVAEKREPGEAEADRE